LVRSGLEIWRIEKMLPVRVPKKKYGKFYAGDSYLCLNTSYKVPTSPSCVHRTS
jgi:hypothetical protein